MGQWRKTRRGGVPITHNRSQDGVRVQAATTTRETQKPQLPAAIRYTQRYADVIESETQSVITVSVSFKRFESHDPLVTMVGSILSPMGVEEPRIAFQ